jgi:transketolase
MFRKFVCFTEAIKLAKPFADLRRLSADIRIAAINGICEAGFGHIGGSMSVADALAALYGSVMRYDPARPDWPERDYLVMSKGHSGPGLYAALAIAGFFPMDWLKTINKPYTNLPSHCDRRRTPGVDMTTGSLAQGISAAAGIALGNLLDGLGNYTYCIVGDGELQEGQAWEAVQFAAHRRLGNFIVLVDNNKKQLDGPLDEICQPFSIEDKFRAFHWYARAVKGYDAYDIERGISEAKRQAPSRPKAIVLDTLKGIGCSFAENAPMNHYMTVDRAMADEAIAEIERRLREGTYPGGEKGGAPYKIMIS